MEINEILISGVKEGLLALRTAYVEPMGLSITAHGGTVGWGFFKYKALPGHPNPGNAGNGWSQPVGGPISAAHAPRDWPLGGSFPWDWQTNYDEVEAFAKEIASQTGFGTDFVLECGTDRNMTDPYTVGILMDMVLLRGGSEHYAYYPDSDKDISYIGENDELTDSEKEDLVCKQFRSLKEKEKSGTDVYMTPPEVDNPVVITGAWYIDKIPGGIVIEQVDGILSSIAISPFKAITVDDMMSYDGQHPRKLHGVPVPSTLYPYYGLTKSDESLSEVLRVRLAPSELERLKAVADATGKTVSEYAREWIRRL